MYYVVRIILLTMMMMMSEATSTAAESASESNPEGSTTGSTSSGRRLLFGQRTTSSGSSGRQQQHRIHSLVSALSFESVFRRKTKVSVEEGETTMNVSDSVRVQTRNMLHGTLDPDGSVEVVFYDALEFGDGEDRNSFSVNFRQRESVVMERIRTTRGGGGGGGGYRESIEASYLELDDVEDSTEFDDKEGNALADPSSAFVPPPPPPPPSSLRDRSLSPRSMRRASAICQYRPPPPPPEELPLRFLRAGKGNVEEGVRRYEATLAWRRDQKIDTILREPEPAFDLIKQHYPHFLCGKGKNGEPIFMEQPPKTNLKALREGGVTLESLLRHYLRVTEFQWQYVIRDDLQHSIYIIDLDGMRVRDEVLPRFRAHGSVSPSKSLDFPAWRLCWRSGRLCETSKLLVGPALPGTCGLRFCDQCPRLVSTHLESSQAVGR